MILGGAISGYSTAELNGTRIERGEKWEVGVEPTTLSFTHSCSTVELLPKPIFILMNSATGNEPVTPHLRRLNGTV